MIQLNQAYKPRPVRFLELWEWQGWRIKVYGISAHAEYPREALVQAARKLAQQQLPQPAVTDNRYGVAYLVIHDGIGGDFVFVDWWCDQNILQHHLYGAPKGQELQYHWPPGASYCVWELAVCWFEREAWVETVLNKIEAPDLEGYLMCRLNSEV